MKELVAGTRGGNVLDKGEMDYGIWSAGQTQGLIHDIPSCAELVARIVAEAESSFATGSTRFSRRARLNGHGGS